MSRKYHGIVAAALFALLAPPLGAEPELPVVSLAYDAAIGGTESDEETVEESSFRHEVALRIREEWSARVVSTLTGDVVRKLYVADTGASYATLQLEPSLRVTLREGVKLEVGALARRALYDEPDSDERPRDYTRVRATTALTLGAVKGLSIEPRLQATWELYDNPLKSKQLYSLGMSLALRWGRWELGAKYNGSARSPLGALSIVEGKFDHAFGVDVSLDPNRVVR